MLSENMIVAAASVIGLLVLSATFLKGWQGWLDLRRLELAGSQEPGSAEGRARIEMADLKERIRKLEAIASGVDL